MHQIEMFRNGKWEAVHGTDTPTLRHANDYVTRLAAPGIHPVILRVNPEFVDPPNADKIMSSEEAFCSTEFCDCA